MTEDSLIVKLNEISAQIKHEDDLIGQRTTWLVTSQSFLFGAFVALLVGSRAANVAERADRLLRFLISLVGLLLPTLVLLAIAAGIYSILMLRAEHDSVADVFEAKGLERPRRNPLWLVSVGLALPIAACLVFLIAWTVILLRIG